MDQVEGELVDEEEVASGAGRGGPGEGGEPGAGLGGHAGPDLAAADERLAGHGEVGDFCVGEGQGCGEGGVASEQGGSG